MSAEKDEQTFENIKQLELVSQIKPLSNPKIFGYYDVAYTKAGSKQDGAPAGGAFRSKLGRLIFKTRVGAKFSGTELCGEQSRV